MSPTATDSARSRDNASGRLCAEWRLTAVAFTAPLLALSVLVLLTVGCDRNGGGAPSDRAGGGPARTADQKAIGDGGRTSGYALSAYDSMLSRYRLDKDISLWCYSEVLEDGVERRVVEVQPEFAESVALRAIEAEAVRDSASAAASMTRLVAALPTDSASPLFGVPFTVRRAGQGSVTGGDQSAHIYMIAVLVRRLPQEDRQLEEQFVVIVRQAVPAASATTASATTASATTASATTASATTASAPWQLLWHERVSGVEEQLAVTDPYALFRVRASGVVAVAFVRESATATQLVVVAPEMAADGAGAWRVRWERTITPCVALY